MVGTEFFELEGQFLICVRYLSQYYSIMPFQTIYIPMDDILWRSIWLHQFILWWRYFSESIPLVYLVVLIPSYLWMDLYRQSYILLMMWVIIKLMVKQHMPLQIFLTSKMWVSIFRSSLKPCSIPMDHQCRGSISKNRTPLTLYYEMRK